MNWRAVASGYSSGSRFAEDLFPGPAQKARSRGVDDEIPAVEVLDENRVGVASRTAWRMSTLLESP
jgi:hypothetical protein